MDKNKLHFILLTFIVILSVFLRFWKLGSYPALNADEAAIGYNVYSLIQTGADEHGNSWPIHFQSFNDFKPGGYFYTVFPFVAVFGLNEWSVRVPNAIFSVLSVLLVYLLSTEVFDKKNQRGKLTGIMAALFLTISPWHIHFSRGGWEVNTATFFMLSGIYLFLKYASSQKFLFLLFSGLSFSASLYTYHAARVIVPLLGLGIIIFYFDLVKSNMKQLLLAALICGIAVFPLAKDLLNGQVSSRAIGVGLFADPGPLSRINEQRGEHLDYSGMAAKVYHNKLINYGLAFLDNWSDHYHGEFLFLSGDVIERNRVPETGQMYMFDFIFVLIGLYWLILRKAKSSNLIIWWFVIAPTAAALTFQSPHALRSQNMVIPLVVISAHGLVVIFDYFRNKNHAPINIFFTFVITIVISISFLRYLHMYWVHMAKEYKYSSQYGVKELVSYLDKEVGRDKKVLVTDRYDQPYILFLFYLKYDPIRFQSDHVLLGRDKYGFSTVPAFDRYEFRSINFDTDKNVLPGYIIAGTGEEIPNETNIIKRVYGTNEKLYFEIVEN